jgi:hypothetical protein
VECSRAISTQNYNEHGAQSFILGLAVKALETKLKLQKQNVQLQIEITFFAN